jgi:hypothetical protein
MMNLNPSDGRSASEIEMMRVYPKVQDPIAVTFTPTTVIASWFNDSNNFQHLTRPANSEFKSYYKSTVENYKNGMFQDDRPYTPLEDGSTDDLKAMFALDLIPLTAYLTERLGHEPRYLYLVLPSVFNRAVGKVGTQSLNDINGSYADNGLANTAMDSPWGFFEGSKLGRALNRWCDCCKPEEEYRPNMVLVLEYEKDYLFAFLHEIDPDIGVPVHDHVEFSRELGERDSKVSQSCDNQGVGAETYHDRLSQTS